MSAPRPPCPRCKRDACPGDAVRDMPWVVGWQAAIDDCFNHRPELLAKLRK